jgi:hypothetical protein
MADPKKWSQYPLEGSIASGDRVMGLKSGANVGWDIDTLATFIAALISDSAPAALDTLNELAAALGDDSNFAATITAALALKASIQSTWQVLGKGANVSHTGSTSETTLATISVPAGAMGPNGMVRVTAQASAAANNANAKTLRLRFGSSAFQSVPLASTRTNRFSRLIANKGAANAQVSYPAGALSDGSVNVAPATMAIDTSAAFDITLTIQLADGSDTVVLDQYLVELIHGA